METKEQEAKEAWREHAKGIAYNYNVYLKGIYDHHAALIEALNEEFKDNWHFDLLRPDPITQAYLNAIQKAISLVKTVIPKKK